MRNLLADFAPVYPCSVRRTAPPPGTGSRSILRMPECSRISCIGINLSATTATRVLGELLHARRGACMGSTRLIWLSPCPCAPAVSRAPRLQSGARSWLGCSPAVLARRWWWTHCARPVTLLRPVQPGPGGPLRNVSGAFQASGLRVAGRRVVLVDDVMTTGSTVTASGKWAQGLGGRAGADVVGAKGRCKALPCVTLCRYALVRRRLV